MCGSLAPAWQSTSQRMCLSARRGRRHREPTVARAVGRRRAPGRDGHPTMSVPRYEVIGVEGIGELRPGDDVAGLILAAPPHPPTPPPPPPPAPPPPPPPPPP